MSNLTPGEKIPEYWLKNLYKDVVPDFTAPITKNERFFDISITVYLPKNSQVSQCSQRLAPAFQAQNVYRTLSQDL